MRVTNETKPVPHPTPESQPYWDGAAAGELRLQRCASCSKFRHYPQLVCDRCYSLEVEWVEASGRGTVHSWTVAQHAFHPAFKADLPYTLVIVDLEEGPRAMGRLDPSSQAQLRIGLPVRVSFERNDTGVALPMFLPSVSDAVSLVPATPEDAGAIRSLTREAYAKWVPVIGREPKPMTVDYKAAVNNHRIDLLHVDGKLVALIEMIPETDHLLIENVAVSPASQGRGLGRKLMAHAEQVAASLGRAKIKLYTNKLFTGNVHLYEKLGYRIDREEAFKGGFTVYMSKSVE